MDDFMLKITLTYDVQVCDEESLESAKRWAMDNIVPDMKNGYEFDVEVEEL